MLAGLLNSRRAIEVSVFVVRAFVKLREMMGAHRDLARQLAEMEKKYDAQFKAVFDALRQLISPPARPHKRIGFRAESV